MDDLAWDHPMGLGPTPEQAAALKARRLRAGGADDIDRDETFTADTLDGRPIPPRIWHVPGLVPGRTVTKIDGDGGTGKSTLGLQLCVATVADVPWIGQDVRQGRALYLSAEDDEDEVHRRLDAMAVHYKLSLERLAGLSIWPLADKDALLAAGAPGKPLEATTFWHRLHDKVRDLRPSLIVLDSQADFYGGNENDRAQVRQFVGMMRRLAMSGADASVILLSHPSLTGLATGSGLSGSTAWNNSVRSRLYLSTPKDDDGGASAPDIRTLAVRKANYGPSGIEYRLRYSVGAFVNEDAGAVPGIDKQIAADRIDRQFLDLLSTFAMQGRTVSHNTGRGYAPALFAKDPSAKGTTSKGFEGAMNRLFAASAIRVATKGPPSRLISFIERADA